MKELVEPERGETRRVAPTIGRAMHRFVDANRAPLGTVAVFVVMMAVFFAGDSRVFSEWNIYRSILTTLPVALFLVVPLVFVVTAGEIDLSFPATMGFAAWIFALVVHAGFSPCLAVAAGIATGAILGLVIGSVVVYFNLSSLVATLGMNFVVRSLIQIVNEGMPITLTSLRESSLKTICSSIVFDVPTQAFWGLAFVIFAALLFNRHRFGIQVKIVGDNPDSARQMGIDVDWVRVKTFIFVGVGAALAGIFSTLINFTWWPTAGEGYFLPVLASVFVGGTPTWGGVGTVVGGAVGALIVSFIETGVVGAGLSGFYVQFFYGVIIILALIGHRSNQARYR